MACILNQKGPYRNFHSMKYFLLSSPNVEDKFRSGIIEAMKLFTRENDGKMWANNHIQFLTRAPCLLNVMIAFLFFLFIANSF